MPDNSTRYIKRFFNENPYDGMVHAGYIRRRDFKKLSLPDTGFCYQCSIILEDTADSSFSAGDIFQSFPTEKPEQTQNASTPVLSFPSDTYFYHVCIGKHTFLALQSCGLLYPQERFHTPLESHLIHWAQALTEELNQASQQDLAEVYLNIQKFLIHLHRPLLSNSSTRNQQLTASARLLLSDSSYQASSIPEIAAVLGLGYENFRKIFKEETGISPLQYRLESNFHLAQRFLTEGMSVKETAAALGYADPYVFSRQFKKYIGKSPEYYKR